MAWRATLAVGLSLFAVVGVLLFIGRSSPGAQATGTITSPDGAGDVGLHTSLALDTSGRPVVSYYDADLDRLKVLRCGNANCTAGNSITLPAQGAGFGVGTSLALNADEPVIAVASTIDVVVVIHCNDVLCAGNDENVSDFSEEGSQPALVLDSGDDPVVSLYRAGLNTLEVVRCNDDDCNGFDEDMELPDFGPLDSGQYSSVRLAVDSDPVISHYDAAGQTLRIVHCVDNTCTGASTEAPDGAAADLGQHTSMVLDALGYPVVSYYDATNGNLKVLHCNDVNCSGNNESITSPDATAADVGQYSSIQLSAGKPVISYYDVTNTALKVMVCNDANCAGSDENIQTVDNTAAVGEYTSLQLDGSGLPVVSYYDATNGNLKVLHCTDAKCAGAKGGGTPTATATSTSTRTPTPTLTPTPTVTLTPTPTPTSGGLPVGGIAEPPEATAFGAAAEASPARPVVYGLILAGVSTAVLAAAGVWRMRRRDRG